MARNDFLIRRLHSLTGLVPVGGFMVFHLLINASVNESPTTFIKNIYLIHSMGTLLPLVEWAFIFIPIIFHAVFGMVIIAGAVPNYNQYRYGPNYRYTLQRVTGMFAFVFILLHVFHMHGWFHNAAWIEHVVRPGGGGKFRPYNAVSTASVALQHYGYVAIYVIGVLSCVFHLANGLWTTGITWGVWTSAKAQARASVVCLVLGLALAVVSMAGLFGMRSHGTGENLEKAKQVENQLYESKIESGEITPNEHKRSHHDSEPTGEATEETDGES